MDEQNEKNVRRFGRQKQKEQLERAEMQFPTEEESTSLDFDVDSLSLPDSDAEALQSLGSLQGEVRAPKIVPTEERYPPLRPIAAETRVEPSKIAAQASPPKKNQNALFYNFMTFIFAVATITLLAWVVQVWVDPQTALNPFAPATPFVVITATANTGVIIPTTPDDAGQVFVVITDTPAAIDAPNTSPYPFVVQELLYAPNSNAFACNWWSIAGTVRDTNGAALNGYRVRVTGDAVNEAVFSGASQAFGDGGFELALVGTPQEEIFTVQLFSPQDAPLSAAIEVQTRADCDANVAIINFMQNR